MERAKSYIARSEDFAKAITDCGALRVIAVMPDASVHVTQLSGYITDVVRHGASFLVKTSHMKGDRYLTLDLI
jgi:hypothetical protein